MGTESIVLQGQHVRLEPLEYRHIDGLVAAAGTDAELYRWSPVPQSKEAAAKYVDPRWRGRRREPACRSPSCALKMTPLSAQRASGISSAGRGPPHPRHGREAPDVCEIGYTWLARSAIRIGANTESKLLMLRHAFEVWEVLRVCFHTDARNLRSQAALERIGGQREGVLRAHRMAADFIPRDSVRYSIIAAEWPTAKKRLIEFMNRT